MLDYLIPNHQTGGKLHALVKLGWGVAYSLSSLALVRKGRKRDRTGSCFSRIRMGNDMHMIYTTGLFQNVSVTTPMSGLRVYPSIGIT